jgi:hypothetical protein
MEVIGHILEHSMAELLSDPRLEAAIRIQSKVPRNVTLKKPETPPTPPKK